MLCFPGIINRLGLDTVHQHRITFASYRLKVLDTKILYKCSPLADQEFVTFISINILTQRKQQKKKINERKRIAVGDDSDRKTTKEKEMDVGYISCQTFYMSSVPVRTVVNMYGQTKNI